MLPGQHETDKIKYPPDFQPELLTDTTDFTLYAAIKHELSDFGTFHSPSTKSLNQQFYFGNSNAETTEARGCVCRCFRNRYASGTFRSESKLPFVERKPRKSISWKSSPWAGFGKYVVETNELIQALWTALSPDTDGAKLTGLVVFSGSTNSAKSSIAKAFALESIRRALDIPNGGDRMPHLVTCEDPIESWKLTTRLSRHLIGDKAEKSKSNDVELTESPENAAEHSFCFTPRERPADVATLDEALKDAKRQTPTCVFIGEVRDASEWRQILDFAGTGHLVVTTTHAARLNETLSRIIRAAEANTPAARRVVAGYLTGCVHLEMKNLDKDGRKFVFPSLWTHRGAALSSLVADGLSSVTPNSDFVFSKSQFLERYLSIKDGKLKINNVEIDCPPGHIKLARKAQKIALDLDIKDLQTQ